MKIMNRIHQLTFDVNFVATPADEQALPVWIQENLLPIIDQLMQQVDEQTELGSTKVKRLKRIEKLEIDLGTVSQAESATELQRRLHSQLLNALRFELAEKNETSLEAQKALAQKTQLLDFLRTGQLSWRLEQHGKHAHKHLLNQVLNQQFRPPTTSIKANTRFEESLSQITQNDLQLTRLVRQFDTPELFQIIKGQLQNWPIREQELILDWLSLELLSLSNSSAVSTSPAAIELSSKSQRQEQFWKHVLQAIQHAQSWQSLIMSWLRQRHPTPEHALNYYRQAIERDTTLTTSTRATLHLVLENFQQQLSKAHTQAATYEVTTKKDLAWSDAEVDALRALIIASRTDQHRLDIEDSIPKSNRHKRFNTDLENTNTSTPDAIVHALKIADFDALAEQWSHLRFNQTELIRTIRKSAWQLWLSKFEPVHCLEIACVLQTNCAWFLSRHQQDILNLAAAERDHLLAQLLVAAPDALNVSDLFNSARLVSRFEIQDTQKNTEGRADLHAKNSETLNLSSSNDLHRVLKAWSALKQKPEALLTLFYRHKQEYLHKLPLSHLLELAQIAYPAIFQIWQADLYLISTIEQHPQRESSLRNLLQKLFSTKRDAISSHDFIALLATQLAKDAHAGFMLQWIKEKTPSQSPSEKADEQNLASSVQASLDVAIENCLQAKLAALFTLRPTLWKHWLAYASEAQQLKLARQFQAQVSDFLTILDRLPPTEKSLALSSALPLLLAALPGAIKPAQLMSVLHPDLQVVLNRDLSPAYRGVEAPDPTIRTPDYRPYSGDEMIDEAIGFHRKTDAISEFFLKKNPANFAEIVSSLMQERGRELAQFWLELQRDQQEQYLTHIDFDGKVDLLALLYPELAQGIHQTINLLTQATCLAVENSCIDEYASKQSSEDNRRLQSFLTAIDELLVCDKHNARSTKEIIEKFLKLFRLRSMNADDTKERSLTQQLPSQIDHAVLTSEALVESEKSKHLNATLPLMLTALPRELKLVLQISDALPSLLEAIKHQPWATNESGTLIENAAPLLATQTAEKRPPSDNKKLATKINFHHEKDSSSDIFLKKNAHDFRQALSNLMRQRRQELAQFWRDLQQDQQEQLLLQLNFSDKLDLLALLYPELAEELHQAVRFLRNGSLLPLENSKINGRLKRQLSDINTQSVSASEHLLKKFLIEIDKLLVSGEYETTSVSETVHELTRSLLTQSMPAENSQALKGLRPSQTPLGESLSTSEGNTQVDKPNASNSAQPLVFTALTEELKLIQEIANSVASLPKGIEHQLSPTNEHGVLVENVAPLLTSLATASEPRLDMKPDMKMATKIDTHQQSEPNSDHFFRKNSDDFKKTLSNLIRQRSRELAEFWRELQAHQQEQMLTQLNVGGQVDLLALLYPELAQELQGTVSLLKRIAPSAFENSQVIENLKTNLKRQSSDIAVPSSTMSQGALENFLIESGKLLISDKHEATSAKEIVRNFYNDVRAISSNIELSLSEQLDAIWSAHSTRTAGQTKHGRKNSTNSTDSHHLLNPLLQGFRSWQKAQVALSQLRLTVDELEQYLHWWILQQTHSDSESPPENYALMLNSIKQAAQECAHPELFMQLVLDALLHEQALDLELFKTQAAAMPMSTISTKHSQDRDALSSRAADEDFHSRFAELSYDKITIDQECSLAFNYRSNQLESTRPEDLRSAFIQHFFLTFSNRQAALATFTQLQRDPGLLNYLNTAQLHQLIFTRLQNIEWQAQFANTGSDETIPRLLSQIERLAYYSKASRDFLLTVWHSLNREAEVSQPQLQALEHSLEGAHAASLLQTQDITTLSSASHSAPNKKPYRLNLKQTLAEIFGPVQLTRFTEYENASEVSLRSKLALNNRVAEHKTTLTQTEFIEWFSHLQSHLRNQAFAAWTLEWLSAHTQSASLQTFEHAIDDAAKSMPNAGVDEHGLLQPENFALILCVLQSALPYPVYQSWRHSARDVFSLHDAFWEKLSQHPFLPTSELYQACLNNLTNTTWVKVQEKNSLPNGSSTRASGSLLAQKEKMSVSSLPPQLRDALPHKLAQAILEGNLQSLELIWDEIQAHHLNLLAQAQRRYLTNLSLREKIIRNNPATRLLDLIAALSHSASVCLKSLWQTWDICRRHLNPRMALADCQKQSIRAAFSYLLTYPNSDTRPSLFLENVLVQLVDAKRNAKYLPDLLSACLQDLNADQSLQSSQLVLAMGEIRQRHLLLENFNHIQDWQEVEVTSQIWPANQTSTRLSAVPLVPIMTKVQVQDLFLQEIGLHAPELIEDLMTPTANEIHTEDANVSEAPISTEITSSTQFARIKASDYPSLWNTALRNSTDEAQEKFWYEYGAQLQGLAQTDDILRVQASALNKSVLNLFAAIRASQEDISRATTRQNTGAQNALAIEAEKNRKDFYPIQAFALDKLSLLLQTRRELSLPEQKFLTLSLSRLYATDKLAWTNFVSTLKDEPSLERYLQLASLHDLSRLFHLLRPELEKSLKDIIKRIEVVFDVSLTLSATVFTPTTWRAIYRAEFIGIQTHHYQDFLIKLFSALAHDSAHDSDRTSTLPDPEICLQKLNAYKPEAQADSDHASLENTDEGIKNKAIGSDQSKTKNADSSTSLNHESHVLNAGMVIVAPYAQRLFGILELTQNGSFVSDEAAQRAVHLLQYVVTGETQTPEFQLSLNKLLCGIHGGIPIVAGIEITAHEQEVIEQMLKGVISHWSALGNTSIQGLRETFLRRQGYLYFEEDSWKLKIPQAGFDMLLDQLPWSFAMIKFPWMQDPLHVTWR